MKARSRRVNRAWLNEHVNDPYVKLARKEGYRSRAAYKLKEIDETLHLFRPGQLVVDLGAAPGAWSQYVRRKLGVGARSTSGPATSVDTAPGAIVALDILPMEAIEGVKFVHGDFRDEAALSELRRMLAGRAVDVIVSDMAPNLSGVQDADGARMSDLVELALEFAVEHLGAQGVLICKAFHGRGYSQLAERFKLRFRTLRVIKPNASRGRSAETYLVGIGPKRGEG
jgi:23S rRNA (uridine2552-2'-O)-methyltransferase